MAGQARRVGLAASVGAELGNATTVRFGDDSLAMAFELTSFAVAALPERGNSWLRCEGVNRSAWNNHSLSFQPTRGGYAPARLDAGRVADYCNFTRSAFTVMVPPLNDTSLCHV